VMIARPQGLFGIGELWDTRWWRRLVGKTNGRNGNGNGTSDGGAPRAIARKLGQAAEPPRPAPRGREDR
jgi:hypothetical protein